ncbi:MAG: hypothetical protein UC708_00130 [Anaerovoracaceae bacterium]|nr:hypothetical protein [Anaerovoracaceae bacterium]
MGLLASILGFLLEAAITFGIIYFVVRVALKKHDSEKEKALKDDK